MLQSEVCRSGADWDKHKCWCQGHRGGRVYTLRNVNVDTRDWTGRVSLRNTHWVENNFKTLQKVKFHMIFTVERTTFISCPLTNIRKSVLQKPQWTGRSKITGSGTGPDKITHDQKWMFKCVIMQHKLLLMSLLHGHVKEFMCEPRVSV